MRKQIEKEVIEALYDIDATQSEKEYFAKWEKGRKQPNWWVA